MNRNPADFRNRTTAAAGFTLVEMLVATALVALMMLLFAQMYGVAIGTMTEQRGMANNDQRARVLSTVIRNDLQNMSYRQASLPYGTARGIVPLGPGDQPIVDPVNQRGYFYYSENDPGNDSDDVLQFTVMVNIGQRGEVTGKNQTTPYTGRAGTIPGAGVNQPDADDGQVNGRGESRAAEISYFLRGGNLYRRVLLLRDPLPSPAPTDPQPTTAAGERRFSPTSPATRHYPDFYRDFDYAATRVFDDPADDDGDTETSYLWFHSIDSLDNTQGRKNVPIALPEHRFGFFHYPNSAVALHHGRPREYADLGAISFLGRLTVEECTDPDMSWPGIHNTAVPTSNLLNRSTTLPFDDNNYLVTGLANDSLRIAEDLLLTHVEAFDVKIFDSVVGDYLDLNSVAPPSSGWNLENANPTYGPHVAVAPVNFNNVFDTWHPNARVFVPPDVHTAPPRRTFLSREKVGVWDLWTPGWQANTDPTASVTGIPYLIPPSLTPYNGHASLVYVLMRAIDGSSPPVTGLVEPEWPLVPGNVVEDGNAVWQCVDNRVGLEGLQITIRYRDIQSGQSRQVTLNHSFVE